MKKITFIRNLFLVALMLAATSGVFAQASVEPPSLYPPSSLCEDTPGKPNSGWCLPNDIGGGSYCGSGGCNCTCDSTSFPA